MADEGIVTQAHFALAIYDVLLAIFDQLSPIPPASLSRPNTRDLGACVLVCRAWTEPALRILWSDLPSISPIWHLLAPSDLPYPSMASGPESEYFDPLTAAKLHESPERWAQLLRYASRVRTILVGQSHSSPQQKLARTILRHNRGVSVFTCLKKVYWLTDSRLDVDAYSPLLLTPELRTATFFSLELTATTPDMDHVDLYDGKPTEGWPLTPIYGLFRILASSSPHLEALEVCSRLPITCVSPVIRHQSSFNRLRTVYFGCSICHSILLLFATKSHIESIHVSNVVPDIAFVSIDGRTRASPTLAHLDVSGDWMSLYHLFCMLDAPSLQSATLNIHQSEKFPMSMYAGLVATFVQAISSAALTKLALNISGQVAPHSDVVEYLSLPSLLALKPILEPLLALRNLRSFTLSSPIEMLEVTDEELELIAQNWPLLVDFSMQVSPLGRPPSGPRPSGDGNSNSTPSGATTRALYFFWRYCPALRRLVLPRLDVEWVAARDLPPLAPSVGAAHPLSELRVLIPKKERDDAEDQDGDQDQDGLPEGEARALAAYIHRLFPGLVLGEGQRQPSKEEEAWRVPRAWRKVLACLGDFK